MLMDTEKVFVRFQHLFMLKRNTLGKLGIEGNYLCVTKAACGGPTVIR